MMLSSALELRQYGDFLDLLTIPQRYLRHHRFAWIRWPALLSPIAIAWHPSLSVIVGISIVSWLRINYLLPQETAWLKKARTQAQQLNFNSALATLSSASPLSGYSVKIQAKMLEVRILLNAGNHLKAQQVLTEIDTSALTAEELTQFTSLRAFFYQTTGDLKSFIQIARNFSDKDIISSVECTLLKAEALLLDEQLLAARETLETRINITQKPSDLFKLYNNLARCDEISGYKRQKLIHLRRAWHEWKKSPEPAALEYLIHNLAVETIRDGNLKNANNIVQDAFLLIDQSQPDQFLMWHNVAIEIAREANNRELLKSAYKAFDKLCPSLSFTAAQRLTLQITRLRMNFNDGLEEDTQKFPAKIHLLLDNFSLLSTSDQLISLKEIGHNVEQFAMTRQHSRTLMIDLEQLRARCNSMVLERADMVEAQLETLTPALINQRQHWFGLQHHLEKISIQEASTFPKRALENLFKYQKESAELHQNKGIDHAAIHAWMVICDEYLAYMEHFFHYRRQWITEFKKQHEKIAIYALTEAEKLLKKREITHGLEDTMIGVAEFSLKLKKDKESAHYWIERFDERVHSLNHYAYWFREKYRWVKAELINSHFSNTEN